jgi:Icc-related predicted phosphoesterase
MRLLAVSDEVDPRLETPLARRLRPDILLGAGDLETSYLEYLTNLFEVPLVFVPGNHDPDLSGVEMSAAGLLLRAGLPTREIGPAGGINADEAVVDVAGLRIAGLGGSIRYRPGPNQYSQRQQARRGRRLVRRASRARRRNGHDIDILLTHSPPLDCGDDDDPPHRGFAALHDVVAALQPRLLLHGHIHPYGQPAPDRHLGDTRVVNVVGHKLLELSRPSDLGNGSGRTGMLAPNSPRLMRREGR